MSCGDEFTLRLHMQRYARQDDEKQQKDMETLPRHGRTGIRTTL